MGAMMERMSALHPDIHLIGTWPGIVHTDLATHGTFPDWLKPFTKLDFAMPVSVAGRFQASILTSANVMARPLTYFTVDEPFGEKFNMQHVSIEGRLTFPKAYDKVFQTWVMAWLEEIIKAHGAPMAP